MKNILAINPPNKPFTNKSIIAEPIDVLEIATIINKRYTAKVIDMDAERIENNINKFLKKNALNVLVFVYDYQIPLHKPDTLNNIFKIIKNCNQKITSIIIGKTPSYFHEYLSNNGINIIISGKAESRINTVINNINNIDSLKRIKGLYINNEYTGEFINKQNYSNNPMPNRSLINHTEYMETKTIITSRGCNGCCSFCSTPSFFGKWEPKNSDQVIKEIKDLIKKSNTKQIIFLDDNFTVSKQRVVDICNKIIKKKIRIKLGCLSSIKNYNKEMFELMYKAGFRWVHIGIESGSQRILKEMNKNFDIHKAEEIIKELKAIGYRIRTSFILDYPSQTNEEFNETINLIKRINSDETRLHFLSKRVYTKFVTKDSINNQYIHMNNSSLLNKENLDTLNKFITEEKTNKTFIATEETNWNDINNIKLRKIISFVPIKYGINWHE